MSVQRLVPLHAVALASDPVGTRVGEIYFNTTANELRFYNGTIWAAVTGAITGVPEHTHSYDGPIFSVDGNPVPSSGVIDGGTP
jgi:hypothetical protein